MTSDTKIPRWLAIAGRVGASTLTIGVLVAGVGVAASGVTTQIVSSLPGGEDELFLREVSLTPPGRELVCVGPMLAFIPQDTNTRAFAEPMENIIGDGIDSSGLDSPGLFNERGIVGEEPAAPVTIHRQPSSEPGMAAVSRQSFDTDVLRGFATAGCLPPQFDTWIAAGSTETGRQAVLSLANPGEVPAIVDVTVYGRAGAVSAPAARGILIQPGTRRVFPLTGFTPDEPSLVVHVAASGAEVSAVVHQSIVRGLAADGMAIVTGQFEVSEQIVIPGIVVDSDEMAMERRQVEGFSDLAPLLRLLSPYADAEATIRILRPSAADVVSRITLREGRVQDIALDELGSGIFSVIVESNTPLVGGARMSAVGEQSTDLSWVSAQPILDDPSYVSLPFGPEATLSFVSFTEDVEATVSRLSPDGRRIVGQTTVRIPRGETVSRVLGVGGGGYLIDATGPFSVAAILSLGVGIGHVATAPTPPEIPPVPVYAR